MTSCTWHSSHVTGGTAAPSGLVHLQPPLHIDGRRPGPSWAPHSHDHVVKRRLQQRRSEYLFRALGKRITKYQKRKARR